MELSNKQRVFVEEYLRCWNASEAARRAGYKHPAVKGCQLMKVNEIAQAVESRLKEKTMSADEVLARLSEQARGDIRLFMDIVMTDKDGVKIGTLAGFDFGSNKPLHLLKKVTLSEKGGISVEMYDAQAALQLIGRHLKLFTDKIEVSDWREEARRYGVDPDKLIERLITEMGSGGCGEGSVGEAQVSSRNTPDRPGAGI